MARKVLQNHETAASAIQDDCLARQHNLANTTMPANGIAVAGICTPN
jgi:hypothetical protein